MNDFEICTIHEVHQADGLTFIAMALREGGRLRHRIAGRRRWVIETVLDLIWLPW